MKRSPGKPQVELPPKPEPIETDTAAKVMRMDAAEFEPANRVHQKHLKSSLASEQFYQQAEDLNQWEV